mmetsp:Transcript_10744/g.21637  ORF Transcript_10744/g.21637 Transcript_10744/m.21637 type:complete len:123 (+) Transcript_10744:2090-2458(+)
MLHSMYYMHAYIAHNNPPILIRTSSRQQRILYHGVSVFLLSKSCLHRRDVIGSGGKITDGTRSDGRVGSNSSGGALAVAVLFRDINDFVFIGIPIHVDIDIAIAIDIDIAIVVLSFLLYTPV